MRLTGIEFPSLKSHCWGYDRLMILFPELADRSGVFFLINFDGRAASSLRIDFPRSPGCMRSFHSFSISRILAGWALLPRYESEGQLM